jgi:polyhydroxyalkanoate synthase
MISWANPDASFRSVRFDDYMQQGTLAALDIIERITGERQVSAAGYCLGGILLAATLAYCDGAGEHRFASATYFASSIDFSDPGDMGVLVDEGLIESVEQKMQNRGYFDGRLLSAGFNLLKENDLFWNYYVLNYLKGERPAAFDLMHWNSDNTNVPAATHRFIMRELHMNNRLVKPDGLVLNGRIIDMRNIVTPTYVLAAVLRSDATAARQCSLRAGRLRPHRRRNQPAVVGKILLLRESGHAAAAGRLAGSRLQARGELVDGLGCVAG